MKVLVTGAAGFIGSHLADRFIEDGHSVVGIDNLSTGMAKNINAEVEFIQGDVAVAGHWEKIVSISCSSTTSIAADADLIVHCAASYDDRNKWHRDTDTNVQGAINVAIAAAKVGARVIYFQTALIYGNNPYVWWGCDEDTPGAQLAESTVYDARDSSKSFTVKMPGVPVPLKTTQPIRPQNSYAISKYAAEQYLRLSSVPLLTLRLANIYGPRNLSGPLPTFYKRITEGDPCTIVDSRRDFVYIDDLVDLVAQAVDGDATGTYHVSTGHDYEIGQLYSAVVDALGAHSLPFPETTPRGEDDAPTILLDPSETLRDFGWQATTELDEGVDRAVAWYRDHGVERTFTHLAVKG